MFKRLYSLLHRLTSAPDERGFYSGGYLQKKVREEASSMCENLTGRLLEIGCGEGLFIGPLAARNRHARIWGLDNSENRLEEAKARISRDHLSDVELRLGEAARLPFADGYFDIVVCVNTIFNMRRMEDVKKTLAEMARVLKAGGKMIFDFRNSMNLLLVLKYRLAPFYDDTLKGLSLNTFSLREINMMLDGLGVKIAKKRYIPASFERSRLGRTFAPVIIVEARKG